MLNKKLKEIDKRFLNSYLFKKLNPRKARIYCVGTPKSGTHSIRQIFKNNLRASHEPERLAFIDAINQYQAQRLNEKQLVKYLRKRDRRLWLEVDSSFLNYFFLDQFIREMPDSKFILTIRDPYSWMDSWLNHELNVPMAEPLQAIFDQLSGKEQEKYAPEEKILEKLNLPSLKGLLQYWEKHNSQVISKVPGERLLVVRTDQITDRQDEILKFAGVLNGTLPQKSSNSHAYKAKQKHHILNKIDPNHLKKTVNEFCSPVVEAFFPEINVSTNNVLRFGKGTN
ncbi:hypothetical protein LQ318_02225 [Aliifodinibius salicampi]|uniref:Sulfotransferase family protein n=1 Tax=Fodinibius salicampi TaxID=1920655 RepID=A0ABT3PV33_9BACT|nr:sulfotransferase [Fodinibius salicampi]MCW9711709.1 hypothetical protein [Fodinibius salicampi]